MPLAPSTRVVLAACAVALGAGLLAGCSQASRLNAKCMADDVAACNQLGDMYANGRGVARDLARAGQAYERACSGGAADTCNTLGEIVDVTGTVDGGSKRAEQLFQKACQGGSSRGCLNLGLAAAARDEKTLAVSLYEKSCTGGWAAGCHQLAASYAEGDGVEKDVTKAVALYTQACDGEHVDSCIVLGDLYLAGEALPKDAVLAVKSYGKALKVFQVSCAAGNEVDCKERDRLQARLALVSNAQLTAPPPVEGAAAPVGQVAPPGVIK